MTETNPREQKGKVIASRHLLFELDRDYYKVHSQTTNREYDVIKTGDKWECNCPDHKFRNVCCKHIHAVEFSIKLRHEVREKNKVIISPINIESCFILQV